MDTITKLETLIADLQNVLAFLRKHPTLANDLYLSMPSFFRSFYSKELRRKFSGMARSLASGMNGAKLEKEYSDYSCTVKRNFGLVEVNVSIAREVVCEKVVVERIEHAESIRPAWTEERVEWKCK